MLGDSEIESDESTPSFKWTNLSNGLTRRYVVQRAHRIEIWAVFMQEIESCMLCRIQLQFFLIHSRLPTEVVDDIHREGGCIQEFVVAIPDDLR